MSGEEVGACLLYDTTKMPSAVVSGVTSMVLKIEGSNFIRE